MVALRIEDSISPWERIMIIETRVDGTVRIATLKGRMDALTAAKFDVWFSELMQSGDNRLVLDMTGLDYISSAGLRSLLAAAKRIKATGGDLVISGLTGNVAEVFTISGFMTIFKVVATHAEAMSAMG